MDNLYWFVGVVVVNVGLFLLLVWGVVEVIERVRNGYWGDSPGALVKHINRKYSKGDGSG